MKRYTINPDGVTQLFLGAGSSRGPHFLSVLASYERPIALITDDTVHRLHGKALEKWLVGEGLKVHSFPFVPGEVSKSREVKEALENQLFEKGFGRDTLILAFGGGVVLDMAGFIASTYCRGVPLVICPTTLMAMCDVVVGGKTGVNTPYGKNLVGTFYFPDYAYVDPSLLVTLEENEFKNGWVELVKHHLLSNKYDPLPEYHRTIDVDQKIEQSLLFKSSVIASDPYEMSGFRGILNLGHTIGHALEGACRYQLKHGFAVAWGILCELKMSVELAAFPEGQFYDILAYFEKHHLLKPFPYFDRSEFYRALCFDKKGLQREPRFILMRRRGEVLQREGSMAHPVPENVLESTINWLGGKGRCSLGS